MPSLHTIALFLNSFENPFAFGALVAFVALLLSLLRRNYGLSFFLSLGLTFALTHIIKSLFAIARPESALVVANGYRFPSMHTSIAAALLTSLAWHYASTLTSRWARTLLALVTTLLIAFVGMTRVYLHVHETIDVVAGGILGIAISLLFHYLMRRYRLE